MDPTISMPVPEYLLEMYNQPDGGYCSGTFSNPTVTTTPNEFFTHNVNVVDNSDEMIFD